MNKQNLTQFLVDIKYNAKLFKSYKKAVLRRGLSAEENLVLT